MKREAMPLQRILVDALFMQWRLDVTGPINPKSSQGHTYILNATNNFTKWKEARAIKKENTNELISFIEENIFSQFCIPDKFIIDNDTIFVGSKFTTFSGKYKIMMG